MQLLGFFKQSKTELNSQVGFLFSRLLSRGPLCCALYPYSSNMGYTSWLYSTRVKWFLHFFLKFNMLHLFLVWSWNPKTSYKKCFLKYWTISIFLLLWVYHLKKVAPPPCKNWKKFFQIFRKGYQKKQNFALFLKCAEVLRLAKGETFLQKNLFFKTSASFETLCVPF